jgi:MFS family permease
VIALTLSALAWSRYLALSVAAAATLSFGISSTLGVASTMVQESVPDALRGRVMSLYSLAFTGVAPFAALAIARLADVFGMRRERLCAAMLYGVCGVLLIPMLRRTNRESRDEP